MKSASFLLGRVVQLVSCRIARIGALVPTGEGKKIRFQGDGLSGLVNFLNQQEAKEGSVTCLFGSRETQEDT